MATSDDSPPFSRAADEQAKRLKEALERADERCRNLESQLRKSQKLQALGTLATGIAHDFNNLLTVIGGNTELALSERPAEPVRESLHEIKDAFLQAKDLVRRILLFSRREESQRIPVALPPIVEDAVRLLRATLPKTIKVAVRHDADLPLVCADPTAIHQVIMNLGTNAAHAMAGKGGRLIMKMDCIRVGAGTVHPARLVPGSYVRLSVRDKGTGISPEIVDQIFDPFFTTKGDAGTGLGLAVVKGIMHEHKGAVSVVSEPGEGTTFCLFFPEAAPTPSGPETDTVPTVRGKGQHVMYVNDEPSLGRLMLRILGSLGYRCTAFNDPNAAVKEFQATPRAFDAVVVDMKMPGMPGAALVRALTEIRADIPIAIISAEPGDALPEAPGRVRLWLRKPVPMAELSIALRRLTETTRG